MRVGLNAAAPDFSTKDCIGNPFRLSHFQGQKNVVLVFNRGFV